MSYASPLLLAASNRTRWSWLSTSGRTKIVFNFLFFFFYPGLPSQDVVDKKLDENAGRPDGSPVDKELGREEGQYVYRSNGHQVKQALFWYRRGWSSLESFIRQDMYHHIWNHILNQEKSLLKSHFKSLAFFMWLESVAHKKILLKLWWLAFTGRKIARFNCIQLCVYK